MPTDVAVHPAPTWLNRWEKTGLLLLAVGVVAFAALVELRSAFLHRRMGDLGVFLRTAWAVRAGADLYTVTDDNGFHYHYPPLFAILLGPLADPPPGVAGPPALPYAASVLVWYGLNVVFLTLSVHWLARALEEGSSNPTGRPPAGSRRWWALRLLPILACLPPIGHTLMRGQVGLLLLLLLSGCLAATTRGQRLRAGLWLAGAICLKVIPAFLLVFPVYRRDWRCLGGCVAGLFVGIVVIPTAAMGPSRTVCLYQEWVEMLVQPGLGKGTDPARAKELLEVTATDSQSFLASIHNTLYPDWATRPPYPSDTVRRAHWLIGGVLTAVALLVGWGRQRQARGAVLTFAMLTVLMILLSPVCHLHYFCLVVPLVMGLVAARWDGRGRPGLGYGFGLLLVAYAVANALPHFPAFHRFRDVGLAMYAAMVLWALAAVLVRRSTESNVTHLPAESPSARAA